MEDNIYAAAFGIPDFSGLVEPAYAGGFYVMLDPLAPGLHDIRFGGVTSFDVDVTYQLTVE